MLQSAFCNTVMLIQANTENVFQVKALEVIIHLFRPQGTEYVDDMDDNDDNGNDYSDDEIKRKS